MEEEPIAKSLNSILLELIEKAGQAVKEYRIPESLPKLLRNVLEEKRGKGSESTFVCGRLDLPGIDFPRGRAVFAWLGDSRLRLWGREGEMTKALGGDFCTVERWSTRTGPIGSRPHLFVTTLCGGEEVIRVAVYTDGLALMDECQESLPHSDLQALIDRTGETATSDDIAYIEILVGENGRRQGARWGE